MRDKVLFGTMLGLLLFAVGSATLYQLLERQTQHYQSVIDLYFPLQEEVAEVRRLVERQRALFDAYVETGEPSMLRSFQAVRQRLETIFSQELMVSPEIASDPFLSTSLLRLQAQFNDVRGEWTFCNQIFGSAVDEAVAGRSEGSGDTMELLMTHAEQLWLSVDRFEATLYKARATAVEEAAAARSFFHTIFLIMVLCGLLTGVVINVYLSRSLKPVGDLVQAVRRIGSGDFSARVAVRGTHELAFVAQEINQMAADLITQRRTIEENQKLLDTTFEGIRDALLIRDAEGKLLHANPAARALLETTAKDGCSPDFLERAEEPCGRDLFASTAGNGFSRASLQLVQDRQRGRHYEILRQPVVAEEDEVHLIIEFIRDVTDRVRLERFERQTERLSAAGEIALGVAHEIRNPMSTIQMTLDTLRRREEMRPTDRERLELARREVIRIEALISSLLEYGRLPVPRVETILVSDLLHRALQIAAAEGHRHQVELLLSPPPPPDLAVEADPDQIVQVLVNLLLNAVQASPEGSEVQLTARRKGDGEQAAAELLVIDRGSGVAEEDLAKIFSPFYTQRPRGTGLGLPVADKIARANGGELSLQSVPGEGTQAGLILPLQAPAGSPHPSVSHPHVGS